MRGYIGDNSALALTTRTDAVVIMMMVVKVMIDDLKAERGVVLVSGERIVLSSFDAMLLMMLF